MTTPHHDGSALHVSNPSPRLGERVTVFLRTPRDGPGTNAVWLRTAPDGDTAHVAARPDRRTATEQWWRADVDIRNPVTRYRFALDGPDGVRWCSAAGTHAHSGPDATDFALVADAPPPRWASGSVIYQVFPDRFARSPAAVGREHPPWALPAAWDDPVIGSGPDGVRQVYGGDLDGLRERLDHVADLGANVLYLTPIFRARSNHRYDASSFTEVDPLLGGNAAYARLCAEVHRRGWHVVGDLTMNHVGDDHPWFRTARAGPAADEREMFYFDAALDHGYEAWAGVPSLPKLNWRSAELYRRMLDGPDAVVRRWTAPPYRQDGWRIDVAHMVGRRGADDETRAVSVATRRALARTGREILLTAEHCHDASADLLAGGWDGTMNYSGFTAPVWAWLRGPGAGVPLLGLPFPVPRLAGPDAMATMRALAAVVPWVPWSLSWNLLDSHDTARIRSVVPGRAQVEVAAGLMVTLPGLPMIFAGDEIGMEGTWGEDARRPMPWDRAGDRDADLLRRYRGLVALRHTHHALREGGHRWIHIGDDVVAFVRESVRERLLVVAARAPGIPVAVPAAVLGLTSGAAPNVHGGAPDLRPHDGRVTLPADGPSVQLWQLPPA